MLSSRDVKINTTHMLSALTCSLFSGRESLINRKVQSNTQDAMVEAWVLC